MNDRTIRNETSLIFVFVASTCTGFETVNKILPSVSHSNNSVLREILGLVRNT
jgi:uncharacterized membrane protein required for colicin V production